MKTKNLELLALIGLLMAGVVALSGCIGEQEGLQNKFPEKIGEYSKTGINNMPLGPTMESNVMVTYSGHQGWAIVSLVTYKTEEAARMEYSKAGETGRKECEVAGFSGMCKTDFSYNTVTVSFGWQEGKTPKIVAISKQKQASENINDIERECKEKIPLFIDAFKGL